MWGEAPESVALGRGNRNWVGGRGKRRWCGGLVFEKVGVSYHCNPDPPYKKGGEYWGTGSGRLKECLTKSVLPRVSLQEFGCPFGCDNGPAFRLFIFGRGGTGELLCFHEKHLLRGAPKYLAVGCAPGRVQEIPSTAKKPLA